MQYYTLSTNTSSFLKALFAGIVVMYFINIMLKKLLYFMNSVTSVSKIMLQQPGISNLSLLVTVTVLCTSDI